MTDEKFAYPAEFTAAILKWCERNEPRTKSMRRAIDNGWYDLGEILWFAYRGDALKNWMVKEALEGKEGVELLAAAKELRQRAQMAQEGRRLYEEWAAFVGITVDHDTF